MIRQKLYILEPPWAAYFQFISIAFLSAWEEANASGEIVALSFSHDESFNMAKTKYLAGPILQLPMSLSFFWYKSTYRKMYRLFFLHWIGFFQLLHRMSDWKTKLKNRVFISAIQIKEGMIDYSTSLLVLCRWVCRRTHSTAGVSLLFT